MWNVFIVVGRASGHEERVFLNLCFVGAVVGLLLMSIGCPTDHATIFQN
jgi:hypothetical protein